MEQPYEIVKVVIVLDLLILITSKV